MAAMRSTVDAYRTRWNQPPRPLLVPAWLEDLAKAKGEDLDAMAREYGFDGYKLYDDA
jgi:hypothetical protein